MYVTTTVHVTVPDVSPPNHHYDSPASVSINMAGVINDALSRKQRSIRRPSLVAYGAVRVWVRAVKVWCAQASQHGRGLGVAEFQIKELPFKFILINLYNTAYASSGNDGRDK